MSAVAGHTILVTRSAEDARTWTAEIERRGARAVVLPCLATQPIDDGTTADRLRAAVAANDWFVVTSRNGVHAVAALVPGLRPRRVAAVGPKTGRAARAAFGRVDLVASAGTAASLAHDLAAAGAEGGVVLAVAEQAGRDIEDLLGPRGVRVVRIEVYRTIPAPPRAEKLDLAAWGIDAILLASPSAVEGLLNQALVPAGMNVISIGPTTSAAVRRAGLTLAGEAARPGLDGLLEALP